MKIAAVKPVRTLSVNRKISKSTKTGFDQLDTYVTFVVIHGDYYYYYSSRSVATQCTSYYTKTVRATPRIRYPHGAVDYVAGEMSRRRGGRRKTWKWCGTRTGAPSSSGARSSENILTVLPCRGSRTVSRPQSTATRRRGSASPCR